MFIPRIKERANQKIPLDTLHNQTIQFATYMPSGSRFVSLGRKITILAPEEAVKIASGGSQIIPALINLLHDEERDWAANVILASISEQDALRVSVYASNIEEWKETQKEADIRYWEKWQQLALSEEHG